MISCSISCKTGKVSEPEFPYLQKVDHNDLPHLLPQVMVRLLLKKQFPFGISRCKPVCIGWINNKALLYSTGNCIQYPVINHNGKEYDKECIYMYNWITLLYSRNSHNIVKQLYFNKKKKYFTFLLTFILAFYCCLNLVARNNMNLVSDHTPNRWHQPLRVWDIGISIYENSPGDSRVRSSLRITEKLRFTTF